MATLAQLRQSGRSIPRLLFDALVLWSPLALVILALALVAQRLSTAALDATYRLTTLDEFCEPADRPGVVLPCTGMEGVLRADAIRPVGWQADLHAHVQQRFQAARRRLAGLDAGQLREIARQNPNFSTLIAPGAVLGLDRAPEDDPELVRLKAELRALARPPATMLDYLQLAGQREQRNLRIRALAARVVARRAKVNQAEYGGLSPELQAKRLARNQVSYWLAREPLRPDAQATSALRRLVAGEDDAATIEASRAGLARALARSEDRVIELMAKSGHSDPTALYAAFDIARKCTVASVDPELRLRSDDHGLSSTGQGLLTVNSGGFDCFELEPGDALELRSLGFRESVRRSIDRWHAQATASAHQRLGALARRGLDTPNQARAVTAQLASVVPAGIHLGRQDCGWLHPVNCLANAAREGVEDSYAEAVAKITASAPEGDSERGAAAADRVGHALLSVDDRLEAMRATAHAQARRFFLAGDLLRWSGWLLLALVVVKSYLYVLALEVFHSDQKPAGGEELAIGFAHATPVQGDYRVGRRVTIDPAFPHAMVTRKQLSNTDHNVEFAPWPGSSPIARILRGRYFIFSRGRLLEDAGHAQAAGDAPRGMVASAGGGQAMVEWRMREGEEVVFRYQDFFGASENVRLRSEFSLRLSTLLLGRLVFHVARCESGEGRLLLRADVEEIDQSQLRAVPPERLIAWNRHARFTVHSGRTPWKTLLNGFTLVRQARTDGPGGLLLVSSEDAGSNLGSIRYVRRIFSAIF